MVRPTQRLLPLAAVLLFAALPVGETRAQAIDFGAAAGEDVLLGEGPVAVSGSDRDRPRPWRGSERRGWRDGDWGQGWRAQHRDARSGYRQHGRSGAGSPSVILYERAPAPSTYYRGTGVFANAQGHSAGVLVYGDPAGADAIARGAPGPRIIDVASERLDRRPIGAGGVSVTYVGSAKIIRVAAGYGRSSTEAQHLPAEKDMAALPAPASERSVEPRAAAPLPSTAPRAAPDEGATVAAPGTTVQAPAAETTPRLEPWTDEWLADCVERYPDFDATLGTYTAEDGRRRFCTGEPS